MSNSRSVASTRLLESFYKVGLRNPSSRLIVRHSALDFRSLRDDGASSSTLETKAVDASLSRRLALMSLLAAPAVLSAPSSRALELPLAAPKDEFDQEEDSLIELFAVIGLSCFGILDCNCQ